MTMSQTEWETDEAEALGNKYQPTSFHGVVHPIRTPSASASPLPIAVSPWLNFFTAEDEQDYVDSIRTFQGY